MKKNTRTNPKIIVPQESIWMMNQSAIKAGSGGVRENGRSFCKGRFSLEKTKDKYKYLVKNLKMDLNGKKILELGSGSGPFLAHMKNMGFDIVGVEPDPCSYKSAVKLLIKNNLKKQIIWCVKGEKLPFPDSSFDVVVSFQVLEYVQDPFKTLQETKRVLKKGGVIYFVIPNYFSFWEGHYSLPWCPLFLNRKLAKL